MTTLSAQRVAVLLGGSAAERSVSLESGATVATTLRDLGASVIEVDPAEAGWIDSLKEADFAFNLLHGPGGEDGCIQGVCELLSIPYSGSGVAAAALTMDKVMTKRVWRDAKLPTPAFELLNAGSDWSALIALFGEAFVKPAREGSSLGMSRVDSPAGLEQAWRTAVAYGDSVFAEQFVAGHEYTVTLLGNTALPSIRIEPAGDFYDFDAKYISDATGFHCPSGLSEADEAALGDLARQAFTVTGASVWGRVDVIRDGSGSWQLLEVNTVPGMTSHSLVPMAAAASGIDMPALLEAIWKHSMEARSHGS